MPTKTPQRPMALKVPADILRRPVPTGLPRLELTSPAIEDITRRGFLIGAGSLLVLAPYGCGGNGESGGGNGSGGTRTVDTPRGRVEIPADPRRVAALYTTDLANALALGLPVVAGPGEQGQPDAPFPTYLVEMFGERLDGVARVAVEPEPNIEQLAALDPDVVLLSLFGDYDPGFERFEQIAPLVTHAYWEGEENAVVPWREALRRNGEQFGKEAAADDFVARFERRAADMRGRLAERWSGATYAIIDPAPDQFLLSGPDAGHVTSTLSGELGLRLPDSVGELVAEAGERDQGYAFLSYEKLGEIDADVLFVPVYAGSGGTPDRSGIDTLTAQELWSGLPAVRAGRVHEFTGDIVYESGPMASAFLDVVERALLG